MRTVTNKNIISMILLRTGTKSIRGLNYVRTVTKRLSPYLMKSEKGIIAKGPVPYDGREGMFLRLSKRNKSLVNSEDESEDDPRLLGISHFFFILSRATKGNSNPRLKGNRKGIIVKGKEFYIPILNTFPTR